MQADDILAFSRTCDIIRQIAIRSFGLISHVPERVSRWFGAQSDDLQEERESRAAVAMLIRASEHKYQALAKGAGGALAGGRAIKGKKMDNKKGDSTDNQDQNGANASKLKSGNTPSA